MYREGEEGLTQLRRRRWGGTSTDSRLPAGEFPASRWNSRIRVGIPGFPWEFRAGKREGGERISVQEALAGLFPAAGRAPLIPVLDAVNLAAFLGFAADFPGKTGIGGGEKKGNGVFFLPPLRDLRIGCGRRDPHLVLRETRGGEATSSWGWSGGGGGGAWGSLRLRERLLT